MRDEVTSVETFVVPPGWVLVRVATAGGLIGWGEGGVQTWAPAVQAAVDQIGRAMLGEDARGIERHWQRAWRGAFYRGGPIHACALAALDEALWDIAGKRLEVPVHELLGGPARERLRVYPWIGAGDEDSPEQLVEMARDRAAAGFTAVKMTVPLMPLRGSAAEVQGVRRAAEAVVGAVGPACELAIDVHGRLDALGAKRLLAALEGLPLLFVEEPVLAEFSGRMTELRAGTRVPIAAGERAHSRWAARELLAGAVDILQPDVSQVGGISEAMRVAAIASSVDVPIAPHCAVGPVGLAASAQVCFAADNVLMLERDLEWAREHAARYVPDLAGLEVGADGMIGRPTAPGLGITVDETAVRSAASIDHRFRTPPAVTADGAVGEW